MEDYHWCVMVLATGEISYKEHAKKVLLDYFTKHKIPYHFIEEVPQGIDFRLSHPSWWKLLCHSLLPGYDYIITWDLDLLPRTPYVEVISNFHPKLWCLVIDSLAAHNPNDELIAVSEDGKASGILKYNGGLMGIPATYKPAVESIFLRFAPGELPSYEQYYVNNMIRDCQIPVFELPTSLNRLFWDPDFQNATLQHYTATEDAKAHIPKHVESYFRFYEPESPAPLASDPDLGHIG